MDYFAGIADRIGGAQINYHFNFSLQHRYLYVQTSKCACTYLKASLTKYELQDRQFFDDSYRHTKHAKVVGDALHSGPHQPVNRSVFVKPYQLGPEGVNQILNDGSYFKFAVVRNPYSRILSAFLDTFTNRRPPLLNVLGELAELKSCAPREIVIAEVTFEQFLAALALRVERLGWGAIDQHYRLQSYHISDDIVAYDKLFRVEALDRLEQEFVSRFGRGLPPAQRGSHTTGARDKKVDYYRQGSAREQVAQLYAVDLQRFGYQFELD